MDYKNKEKVGKLIESIESIEEKLKKLDYIGKESYYFFKLQIECSHEFSPVSFEVDKDLEKIIKDYLVEKSQAKRQEYIEELKRL